MCFTQNYFRKSGYYHAVGGPKVKTMVKMKTVYTSHRRVGIDEYSIQLHSLFCNYVKTMSIHYLTCFVAVPLLILSTLGACARVTVLVCVCYSTSYYIPYLYIEAVRHIMVFTFSGCRWKHFQFWCICWPLQPSSLLDEFLMDKESVMASFHED